MKKSKPRFKKGDCLYYIDSFDEIQKAKVVGRTWNDYSAYCWVYDCAQPNRSLYIIDDKNSTIYPYKTKIQALEALRDFLLEDAKRVQEKLIKVELEIEKL